MSMDPRRIVRIASAFPPPWNGLRPGPYQLTRAQQALGLNVTVITRSAGDTAAFDASQPFETIRIPANREIEFSFKAAWRVKALLRQTSIDVVHTHGFSGLGALLLKKVGLLQLPIVTTFHILRAQQLPRPQNLRERWTLWQERLCQRHSDAMCAVSDDIAEVLRAAVPGRPVFAVYNGADIVKFSPALREPSSQVRLLFVGALNGRKGEKDLVQACARLRSQLGRRFVLRILGEGPAKGALKDYSRENGLDDSLEFLPPATLEEMPHIYACADIFVLPSASEGMPKALLEAMAAGCAPVVSDVPGCRDLVKHGESGLLVKPGDAEGLAEALALLIGDPLRAGALGQRARSVVEQHYTWAAVAERTEACYDAVLNMRRGS